MIQESHNMNDENIKQIEKSTRTIAYVNEGTNKGRGVMTFIQESDHIRNSKFISKDDKGNNMVMLKLRM